MPNRLIGIFENDRDAWDDPDSLYEKTATKEEAFVKIFAAAIMVPMSDYFVIGSFGPQELEESARFFMRIDERLDNSTIYRRLERRLLLKNDSQVFFYTFSEVERRMRGRLFISGYIDQSLSWDSYHRSLIESRIHYLEEPRRILNKIYTS